MYVIEIDGSQGEGGGQILRTAIGLSAVTGKPVKIFNIRKGRPNPGLQAQHLVGIKAVSEMCSGNLKGAALESTEVEFVPGKIKGGDYKFDVGTAGAVTLVLQSLIIPAIHADRTIKFEIKGGTHVSWSPSFDFFQQIFCRYMEMIGIKIDSEILKYGFYPKGGGLVEVSVRPSEPKPLNLAERGEYLRTDIFSTASRELENNKVVERQIKGAEKILKTTYQVPQYVSSSSVGTCVHMHSHYKNCILGSSVIGEKNKTAEKVGEEAAINLKKQMDSSGTVDEWMSDQLLPFLALAKGKSGFITSGLTKHAETNIWVIKQFLDVDFKIDCLEGGVKISCSGAK